MDSVHISHISNTCPVSLAHPVRPDDRDLQNTEKHMTKGRSILSTPLTSQRTPTATMCLEHSRPLSWSGRQPPHSQSSPSCHRIATAFARDSGISSHSSDSTRLSVDSTNAFHLMNLQTSLPPPVPPHARNSQAFSSPPRTVVDLSKSDRTYQRMGCNSRTGALTICLGSSAAKSVINFKHLIDRPGRAHLVPAQIPLMFPQAPISPVWQRKHTMSTKACIAPTTGDMEVIPVMRYDPVASLPSVCIPCAQAERFFLRTNLPMVPCQDPPNWSLISADSKSRCQMCQRLVQAVGINLFNRDPVRSLKFLERHGFLQTTCPQSVAHFLLSSPGLCRWRIGALLGLRDSNRISPSQVMQHVFQTLDFREKEVDEALRMAVCRFGMPVESQEIERFLHCLAVCYHASHWSACVPAPASISQILLLLYAIVLLQTTLHNKNAIKSGKCAQQTVESFIRNVRTLLLTDSSNQNESVSHDVPDMAAQHAHLIHWLSDKHLSAIYRRIKCRPLTASRDHTWLVNRIANSLKFPDVSVKCESRGLQDAVITSPGDLVKSHRRLVFYCIMLQLVKRPNSSVRRVGLLRHVFLFNDLLLLAKHMPPKRFASHAASATNADKNPQYQLHRHLLRSLRGDMRDTPGRIDRFLTHRSSHGDATNPDRKSDTVSSLLERASSHGSSSPECTRRSRSRMAHSEKRTRKIAVICGIPLSNCVIQLFQNDEFRFGLEFRKPADSLCRCPKPDTFCSEETSAVAGHHLPVQLAALTRSDYVNIVRDLFGCLRESHWVEHELTRTQQ